MKPIRHEAALQLNHQNIHDTAAQTAVPDDPSQSGVRPALHADHDLERAPSSTPRATGAGVTVVFRGVLPMERLVQLIRRRAEEAALECPLRVEVEQQPEAQSWRVRLKTPQGEIAASESGPFLAVTRAFALLQ
jgi:hypothetical protein